MDIKINWLPEAKDSNFNAAESYLTLVCGHAAAKKLVADLRKAKIEHFAAKDILRAAETEPFPANTQHVKTNITKIKNDEPLGPVMLCRVKDHPLIIADGMHRVSAVWHFGEDIIIHALVTEE